MDKILLVAVAAAVHIWRPAWNKVVVAACAVKKRRFFRYAASTMSIPARLPTYAVSHGGGPWPWLKGSQALPGDTSKMRAALEAIPHEVSVKPRAMLVISAHWEEREFTLQTHPQPPMLYDYYGFPQHTYDVKYPAPGSPEVAKRVQELLSKAGIKTNTDASRGFDHGTFVPLSLMYPAADIPVVQLSLRSSFSPKEHLALGRALAPLRDEGILIVGSGLPSYHNLSMMMKRNVSAESSRTFDSWLTRTCVEHSGAERSELLEHWDRAPSARECHPREEHFLPLLVAAGAAEGEAGFRQYHADDSFGHITESGYRFGAALG